MSQGALLHDAKAGPTKPEIRAVVLHKLDLGPKDHFAEVGPCTGAVTIEAARRVGQVTAVERKPGRLATAEKNLAANEATASPSPAHRNSGRGTRRLTDSGRST